ncbi:hypothetical protein PHYPSEUDO_007313 [Phytophthora pseudosyringae]|uniref:Uncharacterized protein n=1 Tax=Phytophthora pseudosyringae TaxID=221518 RepID=A0A8T1VGZ1_9STRA|nr:hypothetical protein PHYPSEUDO_007313 [Phytophthora pseudosyringae]
MACAVLLAGRRARPASCSSLVNELALSVVKRPQPGFERCESHRRKNHALGVALPLGCTVCADMASSGVAHTNSKTTSVCVVLRRRRRPMPKPASILSGTRWLC